MIYPLAYSWLPAVLMLTASAALACVDDCLLGDLTAMESQVEVCKAWHEPSGQWSASLDEHTASLHQRARAYLPWLRRWLMPAGGVMSATFTDDSLRRVAFYGGERDPAIWTGAYLAAEALRYRVTGSPDAEQALRATVDTLHRWWNIAGDRGALARYAAPEDSAAAILATLPPEDAEVHSAWPYEGTLWRWRGATSRDQYQGVLLGYTLAYDALADESVREKIRADLVAFAEQLAQRDSRQTRVIIDGRSHGLRLHLENVVYFTAEQPDGIPTVMIDTRSGEVNSTGILTFWPNPAHYLRQVPGLGWFPDIMLSTQALQLGAALASALYVTENVPAYAERRARLRDYYERNVDGWLQIASRWANSNRCGAGYHGLNIGFMPIYLWAWLESDPQRQARVRAILSERLWPAVAEHKNVFFTFIYAALAPAEVDTRNIVNEAVNQLSGFPAPPNRAVAIDLTAQYPEDPQCPGLSAIAIDVAQRAPASFLWERQPWKRVDPGVPHRLYGGVDYLLAYWLGRYHGFIAEDAPGWCLREFTAPRRGQLEIPQPGTVRSGIGLISGWHCAAARIELRIDGGRLLPVAYGTERADTLSVCGDTDNGFGFLLNYNALGDGPHQVEVLADGQSFGQAHFVVRTLGTEFLTGVQSAFWVDDFPQRGERTLLRWQEARQNFVIAQPGRDSTAAPAAVSRGGMLEIPPPGSEQSGIGLISGWHCGARRIEVQFDDRRRLLVGYGTERADTLSVCGDRDNGFAFLVNYNALGDGVHRVTLYADAVPFAGAEFQVRTLGREFYSGLVRAVRLSDFPYRGQATWVGWDEASQNFTVQGYEMMAAPVSVPQEKTLVFSRAYEDMRSAGVKR